MTVAPPAAASQRAPAKAALDRARGYVLDRQDQRGWWSAGNHQRAIPALGPDWREVPEMQALTAALSALGQYVQGAGRWPRTPGASARAALMSWPAGLRP